MKEVKVVIGKNFGDEGKGAAVHNLCKKRNAIVVRHNGGAQAGHTVEEGSFRFVFHQLGSGSRNGCPTYWSDTFLPDLLKLGDEIEEFQFAMQQSKQIHMPIVYAHEDCCCTTIYDVLLNSIAEMLRGKQKHGSCGMGIYEAVLRGREEQYILRLKDFVGGDVREIAYRLRKIRDGYARQRLQTLLAETEDCDVKRDCQEWIELFYDENVLWNAAEAMYNHFHKYVILESWEGIANQYETIIFENAQGLMLDEDNKEYYPHLTPSHTGLYNVAKLLADTDKPFSLEVIYVTRTYVTRHGAGRLDYECKKEDINSDMVDQTNMPNMWQDTLRYAMHPAGEEFFRYIQKDMGSLKHMKLPVVTAALCLTHLDETDGKVLFCNESMGIEQFEEFCREHNMDVIFLPKSAPIPLR